jgi:ribosomal-protein-alanine N-acetyltransferase
MFELSGPSVVLRLPDEADVPALFTLGSDPRVTRWFSWGPYRDPEEPRAWVARAARERAAGERLALAIVHAGALVGVTELSELSERDRRAVVGTWVGPDWWGRGVNAEAKALVLHLAFAVLGLHRVGAYANVANGRSQRALEKAGFAREGVLRGWHRHGDVQLDVCVYAILRDEWSPTVPVDVRGDAPAAFVTRAAPPS